MPGEQLGRGNAGPTFLDLREIDVGTQKISGLPAGAPHILQAFLVLACALHSRHPTLHSLGGDKDKLT